MYLAVNTFIYETGEVPVIEALEAASRMGFTYVDLAAYKHGDPTQLSASLRRDIVKAFRDHGMVSSQLLLANTELIASPDPKLRQRTIDYMKACAEFQLELGGRQVLVCWGCGVLDPSIPREQSWLNTVASLREFATWCLDKKVIVDLELDPHVYFVVNNLERMAKMLEDVDLPNVYPNVDIGHLCITREAPKRLEKIAERIIHVHLSETDTYEHTNSILGSGKADFRAYLDKVVELGIEENCARIGEPAVADIEMGEPGHFVEDPNRWMQVSLDYVKEHLPELRLS